MKLLLYQSVFTPSLFLSLCVPPLLSSLFRRVAKGEEQIVAWCLRLLPRSLPVHPAELRDTPTDLFALTRARTRTRLSRSSRGCQATDLSAKRSKPCTPEGCCTPAGCWDTKDSFRDCGRNFAVVTDELPPLLHLRPPPRSSLVLS